MLISIIEEVQVTTMIDKRIGKRVKECRERLGITQEELAEKLSDKVALTGDASAWIGGGDYSDSGTVISYTFGGTKIEGSYIRDALGLRSASFTVAYDGETFTFTTLGWGHGVGMSQAGAIYMAQNGAAYREILAYFYPGAELG